MGLENEIVKTYSAGDIAKLLDVSVNVARDFLEDAVRYKLFPVVKVGVQYRVPIDQFDEWNKHAMLHQVSNEGTCGCEMARCVINPMESTVYRPSEIQKILGFSRSKTYTFIAQVYAAKGPFKVLKIGKSYRVNKVSFDEWLNGDCEL